MSRNLMKTNCDACPAPRVTLVEAPRPIRAEECGVYSPTYLGMTVANAECPQCGAKYLAWVRGPFAHHWDESADYSDLSYRSSFNDEPGVDDLPVYEVKRTVTYERVRKITRCPNGMDLDRNDHADCRGCAWDDKIRKAAEAGWWGLWFTFKDGVRFPHYVGPWATRAEAEAVRARDCKRRAQYAVENMSVEQWTPELVPSGLYNPKRA